MGELLNNYSGISLEAGCDEAGRGCLAGPVFAAAVILPEDYSLTGLDDSKKLTERKRSALRPRIERDAVAWCVASASAAEIDEMNILRCSILAMQRALDGLSRAPGFVIVDGNRFCTYSRRVSAPILGNPENISVSYSSAGKDFMCIVRGDGTYKSIAAASILAKTHRDEYMTHLSIQFPEYGWDTNKGYPTAAHRAAIAEFGVSPHHRKTFALLRS
ncbi:MAG: ribonuclease HII [Bacteroidales bacterium]|nr:ribonuclease HII [Bacteroidales bacterium]MCI2144968.1 ribonuclease HII [Bacteroidales bacterium]